MSSYTSLEDPEAQIKRPRRTAWWAIGVGLFLSVVVIVWSQWPYQRHRHRTGFNAQFFASSKSLKPGQMNWTSCVQSDGTPMECGYIIVPLDYHDSSAGVAKIALSRLKSVTQPRKGTIFYNPGGPGDSGKQAILKYGKHLQAALAPDYDWVGFDPRGIGETQPQTRCFIDGSYKAFLADTVLDQGYDIIPSSNDKIIHNGLIHQQEQVDILFKQQFEKCEENMGDVLQYMGTTYVSRDIEFMASRLDGKDALINYYGVSYGSVIGSYLVNMFPDRVGRVVLDGVVNPMLWTGEPAYRWYQTMSEDIESAYIHFFRECSRVGPSLCPLAKSQGEIPEKMKVRVQLFLNGLYKKPMNVREATTPSTLTSGRAFIRIYVALQHPLIWRNLSIALHEAMGGNATLLMNLGHSPVPNDKNAPPHDLQRAAVSCNDQVSFSPPTTKEVTTKYMEALGHVSRFALSVVATEPDTGCQFWPVKPPERFAGPWNHTLSYPILIHSNKMDPTTPLSGGLLVNSLLPKCSSLVVRDGPGHCSFAVPSLCTVKASREYFKDGTLPSNRHQCQTDLTLFTNNISKSLSGPDQALMNHVHSIALHFNHML